MGNRPLEGIRVVEINIYRELYSKISSRLRAEVIKR